MSDVMFYGILNMPYEMAMNNELSRFQFYQTVRQALDRLAEQEKQLAVKERDYNFMKDLAIASEAKMNEALEQNKMLKEFVQPILAHDEDAIGDWDGFDLEELALKTGLYYKVLKNEPCNTGKEDTHRCLCREYDCDFPTDCNRVVNFLLKEDQEVSHDS